MFLLLNLNGYGQCLHDHHHLRFELLQLHKFCFKGIYSLYFLSQFAQVKIVWDLQSSTPLEALIAYMCWATPAIRSNRPVPTTVNEKFTRFILHIYILVIVNHYLRIINTIHCVSTQ